MRENLITERKQKQLPQTATASIGGVTVRQYKNLEAGTSDGSIKVWKKLSKYFGKTIDHLLEQVPTPTE